MRSKATKAASSDSAEVCRYLSVARRLAWDHVLEHLTDGEPVPLHRT